MDLVTLALSKKYTEDSLKGAGALKGNDGKSAYEIALMNGFEGTEKEWLASLYGKDGNGISDISIDGNGDLIIKRTDGDDIDAGQVVPQKGKDYYTSKEKAELVEEITNSVTPEQIGAATQDEIRQLAYIHNIEHSTGSSTYPYKVIAGHTYKLEDYSGSYVNARTIDADGKDVDVLSTINPGKPVTFVASKDAVSLKIYAGAAGTLTIEDKSLRIPVVEERVSKLESDSTDVEFSLRQLIDIHYIETSTKGEKLYSYNFVAGHQYRITNNTTSYVTAKTKDVDGEVVDVASIDTGGAVNTFTATGDAVTLYLYFGEIGSITLEDLSLRIPALEDTVNKLQEEVSELGGSDTPSNSSTGLLESNFSLEYTSDKAGTVTQTYKVIAGHSYRITKDFNSYVNVTTKVGNTAIDKVSVATSKTSATFTATADAETVNFYFGAAGNVVFEDITLVDNRREIELSEFGWSSGTINPYTGRYSRIKLNPNNGSPITPNVNENSNIVTGFIPVLGYNSSVNFKGSGNFMVVEYVSNNDLAAIYEGAYTWLSGTTYTIKNDTCRYIRIVARKLDKTDLTADEIKSIGSKFTLNQYLLPHRLAGRYIHPMKEDFIYEGELEDFSRVCTTDVTRLQKLYALWDSLYERKEYKDTVIKRSDIGEIEVEVTSRDVWGNVLNKDGIAIINVSGETITDENGDPLKDESGNIIDYTPLTKKHIEKIRCYTITPTPLIDSYRIGRYSFDPFKILYVSGIHSGEGCIAVDDFVMFKNLVEHHSPKILWDNCVFEVIPVANPFGYDNYTRLAKDRVNLNRNFPYGWSPISGVDADGKLNDNYSGTGPGSEYETKLLMNFVKAHPDAFLVINRHNTDRWPKDGKIGYATGTFQSDLETIFASCMSTDTILRDNNTTREDGFNFKDIIDFVSRNNRIVAPSHSDTFGQYATFDRWYHSIGYHGYLLEYTDRFDLAESFEEYTEDELRAHGIVNEGRTKDKVLEYTNHNVRRMSITAIVNLLCDSVLNNREIIGNCNKVVDRLLNP